MRARNNSEFNLFLVSGHPCREWGMQHCRHTSNTGS